MIDEYFGESVFRFNLNGTNVNGLSMAGYYIDCKRISSNGEIYNTERVSDGDCECLFSTLNLKGYEQLL